METNKNESLADDNTTLMELTGENLRRLRNILDEFGNVSGLRCNYDKTMVMPIGNVNNVPTDLHGFVLTDKIKLLGMDITNNIGGLSNNFHSVLEKITKLILFWERFKLSIPGRISIVKTLLMPQLNYLGCFISPDDGTINLLQDSIDNFVLKGQPMTAARRYLKPEQGGLGIFNIADFLNAQKCSWIKRVLNSRGGRSANKFR